eukprot:3293628-Prymnesium_polylepis.1
MAISGNQWQSWPIAPADIEPRELASLSAAAHAQLDGDARWARAARFRRRGAGEPDGRDARLVSRMGPRPDPAGMIWPHAPKPAGLKWRASRAALAALRKGGVSSAQL